VQLSASVAFVGSLSHVEPQMSVRKDQTMPLNVYEFSLAGSNRVAVTLAESRDAAERFFSGMPPGECFCEMNHPG
jgi:hypothetical protein